MGGTAEDAVARESILRAQVPWNHCVQTGGRDPQTREPVVITKQGVPVAQLVPAVRKPETLFGALEGSITILGDIISPIDVEWDALS